MQSHRKLGFQNRDAKKRGLTEISAGSLYSPAAFFIKISFGFWPMLSHHESVFYPTPFQGFLHSRELQTPQPVINFTCECTVLIELRFSYKVDFRVRKLQPKRELLAVQILHTEALNVISEIAQRASNLISQKKRDCGCAWEYTCRRTSAYWTCPGIS